jgi:hypothetical protein
VNPGRPATRLGRDGIDPWVDVRRRYALSIVRLMRREGIYCRITEASTIDDDRYGMHVVFDRISFRSADPGHVQKLLDDWRPAAE